MKRIFERIAAHAERQPENTALRDNRTTLTYAELPAAIEHCAAQLDGRRIGIMMDNSCAWATVDLAIMQRGKTAIPMPLFFTDAQVSHLITDAELDLIVTDQPARLEMLLHLSPKKKLHSLSNNYPMLSL